MLKKEQLKSCSLKWCFTRQNVGSYTLFLQYNNKINYMELIEYDLPEWCFLDGYSHQGDKLKGREVILHTPSMSILEVICLDDKELLLNEGVRSKSFSHNRENFKIVVYKSLVDNIGQLMDKAIDWYIIEVDFINKQIISEN